MATEDEIVKLVLKQLDARKTQVGSQFNLPDLFGGDWTEDYLDEDVRVFGTRFRAAVSGASVPGVEWVERNSANLNIYRRVQPVRP